MSESLKTIVARLPEVLCRNAESMMRRMVDAMQHAIAADPQLEGSSYCALTLRMSANDLVREFDRSIRESMDSIKPDARGLAVSVSGLGLSVAPLDPNASSDADFASSTALFDKLCSKAGGVGVDGFGPSSKSVFIAALDDALTKARIDPAEAAKMMPFARQALDHELAKMYEKLDSVCFGH
jgi:hypothetical protein